MPARSSEFPPWSVARPLQGLEQIGDVTELPPGDCGRGSACTARGLSTRRGSAVRLRPRWRAAGRSGAGPFLAPAGLRPPRGRRFPNNCGHRGCQPLASFWF